MSRRSRCRLCVLRCFLTLTKRSLMRLIESLIIRRSSSIWVSPGPTAHANTRRFAAPGATSAAPNGCSSIVDGPIPPVNLPSWLRARWAKISKNEQSPVVDWQTNMALQIALLCRAQCLVEQHLDGSVQQGQGLDLIGLATAHKKCRIRGFSLAGQTGHGSQTTRFLPASPTRASSASKVRQTQSQRRPARSARPWSERRIQTNISNSSPALRFQPFGSSTQNQAVISPVSGVLKVTERPGTMVEMACL